MHALYAPGTSEVEISNERLHAAVNPATMRLGAALVSSIAAAADVVKDSRPAMADCSAEASYREVPNTGTSQNAAERAQEGPPKEGAPVMPATSRSSIAADGDGGGNLAPHLVDVLGGVQEGFFNCRRASRP